MVLTVKVLKILLLKKKYLVIKKKDSVQKEKGGQYSHKSFQIWQHSALRKQTKPSSI